MIWSLSCPSYSETPEPTCKNINVWLLESSVMWKSSTNKTKNTCWVVLIANYSPNTKTPQPDNIMNQVSAYNVFHESSQRDKHTFMASSRAGRASSRSLCAFSAMALHCNSSAPIFSFSSLTVWMQAHKCEHVLEFNCYYLFKFFSNNLPHNISNIHQF